jgi:hypothetical protein
MEDQETKTRFDREQRSNLEAMTSMHARCGLSRVTVLHWVATFECPWNAHPNGQQPDCHAQADKLEQRARKATVTWAREQCLFSADLWRSLAKEAEARETAAHKLAAE